jgi:hypothetical protein
LRVSYFETPTTRRVDFSQGGVTGLRIVEEIFENSAEIYLKEVYLSILRPGLIILFGGPEGGGDLEEK